jgi:hypothetical protein
VELKAGRAGGGMPLWIAPLPAAALGSICGMLALYVYDGSIAYLPGDMLFFLLSSAIAFVAALAGLVVVGLPLTLLLRRIAYSPWSLAAGAAIGAIVGRLVSGLLNVDLDWSGNPLASFGFPIGAFTGLFWTLFARKRLIRMQETARHATDPFAS